MTAGNKRFTPTLFLFYALHIQYYKSAPETIARFKSRPFHDGAGFLLAAGLLPPEKIVA